MAKVITTAGSISKVEPKNGKFFELEELQKVVGGYIEIINLGNDQIMVVNEEGKLEDLPYNFIATQMCQRSIRAFDYIAGDALVCLSNQIR